MLHAEEEYPIDLPKGMVSPTAHVGALPVEKSVVFFGRADRVLSIVVVIFVE